MQTVLGIFLAIAAILIIAGLLYLMNKPPIGPTQ